MDETQRSLALAKSDDWLLLFLAVINALSFLLSGFLCSIIFLVVVVIVIIIVVVLVGQ